MPLAIISIVTKNDRAMLMRYQTFAKAKQQAQMQLYNTKRSEKSVPKRSGVQKTKKKERKRYIIVTT
jgi:hypothetical protein